VGLLYFRAMQRSSDRLRFLHDVVPRPTSNGVQSHCPRRLRRCTISYGLCACSGSTPGSCALVDPDPADDWAGTTAAERIEAELGGRETGEDARLRPDR
jgi:hypothetical protein